MGLISIAGTTKSEVTGTRANAGVFSEDQSTHHTTCLGHLQTLGAETIGVLANTNQ